MRVWTSKDRVWWFNGSEDKPSLAAFTSFDNTLTENDEINVQFLNYDNVKVNSKTDDITYLKVEHNNRIYYYFVTGVSLILNNAYQLDLMLDRYTTFTLPFIKSLSEQRISVYAIRHHNINWKAYEFRDPLLERVPKYYKEVEFKKINVAVSTGSGVNKWWRADDANLNFTADLNAVCYYVFNDTLGQSGSITGNYTILPVFKKMGTVSYSLTSIATKPTETCYNSIDEIEKLIKDDTAGVGNKFVGIYFLPHVNFFRFETRNINNKNFLVVRLDEYNSAAVKPYTIAFLSTAFDTEWTYNQVKPLTYQLYDYYRYKYFNNDLNNVALRQTEHFGNSGYVDIGNYFIFAGNGNVVFKDSKLPLSDAPITLPYQLPSIVDTYNQYVQANHNTVNTSYNIAKQNAIWNSIKSALGIGTGIGNLVAGNMQGFGQVMGGLSNIAGSGLSLSQKRKQIQAVYKDADRTMGLQMNFSTIQDAMWNYYYWNNTGEQYDGCEVQKLDENTVKMMNNIIYLNGNYLPEIDDINKYLNYNINNCGFRYILLDDEHLSNLVPVYTSTWVPKNEYEGIINELAGGIRLWDKTPTYK